MVQCTNCQETLKEESKFCHQCGTKVILNERCECGNILEKADRFCSQCGLSKKQKKSTGDIKKGKVERLVGTDITSMATRYIQKFNDRIYMVYGKSIWSMTYGDNIAYKLNSQFNDICEYSLNINKHGLFFINDRSIVHLDFEGCLINAYTIRLKDEIVGLSIYDKFIYFSTHNQSSKFGHYSKVYKFEMEDIELSSLVQLVKIKLDEYDNYLSRIYALEDKLIYVPGTGPKFIDLNNNKTYSLFHGNENVSKDRRVFEFNLEKQVYYITEWNSLMEYKICSNDLRKAMDVNPETYSSEKFAGFYGDCVYKNNFAYGFTYGHRNGSSEYIDYYYNLYRLDAKGEAEFLQTGSRGGIENLNILGDYAFIIYDGLKMFPLGSNGEFKNITFVR
ncbi:zinc ribbon domain-containing protein [Lysinibacillus antri]|uniref:Zinc ribbon domain-containing protein n=1 Tax=Lysinibacillus antri TaxID=2498145 RepID=A0A3S0WI98_9BACI|nr:zinc ribbon domain-containing protein [Lysinibacillus antri]RUL55948.1 zinc ribbon domain-containing protein [Lysinibacillus antri]